MTSAMLGGLLIASARRESSCTDADLLGRFVGVRDEEAFAELVRRYGPLVFGVCRRIVPDSHLAEDAFQAVFVVLAAKAGRLDGSRPLGPWLHAVATQVGTRTRDMIGRRRRWEIVSRYLPSVPVAPNEPDDTRAILDEELGKLSVACREALVLCEMQGLSRKQAAKQLGIAEGTLSSRLAAGRKALAERLRGRGIHAPLAMVGVAVSESLVRATVHSAVRSASGVVLELSRGVLQAMSITKWKLGACILLASLTLLAGGLGLSRTTHAAPVPKPEAAEAREPVLAVWRGQEIVVLTTAGKERQRLSHSTLSNAAGGWVRISPDGRRVAVATGVPAEPTKSRLVVLPLAGGKAELDLDLPSAPLGLFWSLGGEQVHVSMDGKLGTVALATGKLGDTKLPVGLALNGVAADGRFLATRAKDNEVRVGFADSQGFEFSEIKLKDEPDGRFECTAAAGSRDGKTVAVAKVLVARDGSEQTVVSVMDAATGVATAPCSVQGRRIDPRAIALSPDGTQVVYPDVETRVSLGQGGPREMIRHGLSLFDLKTRTTTEFQPRSDELILAADWWAEVKSAPRR